MKAVVLAPPFGPVLDDLLGLVKPVAIKRARLVGSIFRLTAGVIEHVLEGVIPEAEQMADAFRVVADAARLRILSLMASSGRFESWVGELTEALGLSQPTVSHHLRVLHEAGLIEREGRTWHDDVA
jgi:predicted transcriptional regulator